MASASHSIFTSTDNSAQPPASVCVFFVPTHSPAISLIDFIPQLPEGVVTDLRLAYGADADAESPTAPRITTSKDPYNIGHGLKSDEEIAELRNRKRGKRLANYHRRQNDVGIFSS